MTINIPKDLSREDLEFDYKCGISNEDFAKLAIEQRREAIDIIQEFTDLFLFILKNKENINEAIELDFLDFKDRVKRIKERMAIYKFIATKPRWFAEVFEWVKID